LQQAFEANRAPPVRLFNYWRSSCSYRVRLALAHKGLAYEYVAVNLATGEQHQPAHRARTPSGAVPVLEVEEGGARHLLAQSVGILEDLEERHPEVPLLPRGAVERAQVRALVEAINSGLQPFHNMSTLNHVKTELHADPRAWAEHFVRAGLSALEKQATATAGRFLFGDAFTLADCCLLPQLYAARRFASFDAAAFPTLARVEASGLALPACALARPEAQPDAVPA
jgi:maleylpyruvate isomerase